MQVGTTMSKPQGKCIFCGGHDLTKEHIWAKWLNPYLPKYIVNHTISFETIFPDRLVHETQLRSGSVQSGRLRRVCRSCNTGWMSNLQEETKPILLPLILGQNSNLHRKAQSILSSWIAMFAMVAEFLDKTETRVAISPEDRLFLKTNLTAPPNMKIWIGYYERDKWPGVWFHATFPISDQSHVPRRSLLGVDFPNTQTTTIVIGKLYIHVLSSDIAGIVRKQEFVGNERKLLYRIHAYRRLSPLTWPPPRRMSDRDADAIASAFSERGLRIAILGS
jgi:hypothetical protein